MQASPAVQSTGQRWGGNAARADEARRVTATQRSLLIVSHPGHELRVFGWVKRHRPVVVILTDGSGGRGASRFPTSLRLLGSLGAEVYQGCPFLRDVDAYEALMSGETSRFVGLADHAHGALRASGATFVAGDAREGYNPMHDVCRAIIDAVVTRCRAEGVVVANRDFPLMARPSTSSTARRDDIIAVRLDDDELAEKLAAAHAYAELEAEVAAQLDEFGPEAFRWEGLRPVEGEASSEDPPFYETFGEQRVREGQYARVLRYREHVRPVEQALRVWAEGGAPA